jgi:hypothetical protein
MNHILTASSIAMHIKSSTDVGGVFAFIDFISYIR